MQLTRAGRLRSEGLVHPIVPFEESAEAYVVILGIRFP